MICALVCSRCGARGTSARVSFELLRDAGTGGFGILIVCLILFSAFLHSFFRVRCRISTSMSFSTKNLLAGGYAGRQVLQQLHDRLLAAEAPPSVVSADDEARWLTALRLSDVQKALIVERIAAADRALLDGASEFLQLLAVCFALMNLIQNV